MKFPVVHIPFLPAAGMAVFPFILVKIKHYKKDELLLRHEKIHLIQQLELLVLPFYLIYFFHYFINLIKYREHNKAYMNIVFEKEAYQREGEADYLKKRKLWSWINYFN
ncbi:hypothetical protein [Desertivirga brevis]|uniref:hypothetical protein n=1 Tax=Desertivirga brevis TaxID=2810310 RepID=UPI001A9642C5|nr:hypothetical protein [Pedobacter sp. SYSU D00873]